MRRFSMLLPLILLTLVLACETVPITGREQLSLIPASQILPMSFDEYKGFLSKHPVVEQGEEAAMVTRVGKRIQGAVERYFAEQNLSSRLKGYQWEFHLVQDKEANAWCMPGGKVVVYTGILPITKDENGLAVVLGHEIAHAVANHGGERMSQALLVEMGGLTLDAALSQNPGKTNGMFLAAYGLGAQVGVLLPYSRLHESEADHLGLIFMAMAGYDPRGAVTFWERMMANKQGAAPPEFMSSHPADARRIENIRKLLPEALTYYRPQ
jgi:predicted Zn-dependent protease